MCKLFHVSLFCCIKFSTMNTRKPPISAIAIKSLPSMEVFKSEKTIVLKDKTASVLTFDKESEIDMNVHDKELHRNMVSMTGILSTSDMTQLNGNNTNGKYSKNMPVNTDTDCSLLFEHAESNVNSVKSLERVINKIQTTERMEKNTESISKSAMLVEHDSTAVIIKESLQLATNIDLMLKDDKTMEGTKTIKSDESCFTYPKTNNSLISTWIPPNKKHTVLPKELLEKVTAYIQTLYTDNKKLEFNNEIKTNTDHKYHSPDGQCKEDISNNSETIRWKTTTANKSGTAEHPENAKTPVSYRECKEHRTDTTTKQKEQLTCAKKTLEFTVTLKDSQSNTQKSKTKYSDRKAISLKGRGMGKTNIKNKEAGLKNVMDTKSGDVLSRKNDSSSITEKKNTLHNSARAADRNDLPCKSKNTVVTIDTKVKRTNKIENINVVKKTQKSPNKTKNGIEGEFVKEKTNNTDSKFGKINKKKTCTNKMKLQSESNNNVTTNTKMKTNKKPPKEKIADLKSPEKTSRKQEKEKADEVNACEEEAFLSNICMDVLQEPVTQEEASVYDLSHLFTGTLDKKYEIWKKREKKSAKKKSRDYHDDKKEKRKVPNYFVSIQITNPEITKGIEDVQNCMCKADKNLKPAMIPLPTLHLTLRVACLEDEDHISRMVNALDKSIETFNKQNDEIITLEINEIGHFRKEVVFAKVKADDCLTKMIELSEILEDCCKKYNVPPSDGKGFTPHITIAKLSKIPFKLKKKVRKIEMKSYDSYKNQRFGKQLVTCLQLCSMYKPKDKSGYYHVSHVTPMLHYKTYSTLSEGKYDVQDTAHIIVTSVIYEALLQLKNSYKKK